MSNGEPKENGRELLDEVLKIVARAQVTVTPTERMRAALSLGLLDGTIDRHQAARIRGIVNGGEAS